ncbi:MAG: histidinol-phosphatase HisJ family protein [Omnitrophica WOR_2 bacterium]
MGDTRNCTGIGICMKPDSLIDYHLHTAVTIDGTMSEEQACERAIRSGIREIAFTNHIMHTEPEYTVSKAAFREHWEQVQVCQERYPELAIRLGLEVDYYEGRETEIAATIDQYEAAIGRPIDLILGSVHHLNGVFFSNKTDAPALYKNKDIGLLYHDYFILATKAVQSHLFDVMAHPDLIKKHVGELSPRLPFYQYRDAVEPFIDALLTCGVGLEVNTKGYKLRVAEAYPSKEMLSLYLSKTKELGKEPVITLGSDAHDVGGVGRFISEGASMLIELGQDSVMSFKGHKPAVFKIE